MKTIFAVLLFCIYSSFCLAENKKKVYIIGHKCNDLKKPGKALSQGVNGIEADFWYEDGKWSVSHDGKFKQDLDEWLKLMGNLSDQYKDQFAVLVFDIKSKASIASLLKKINQYLPKDLNKIYSVPKIDNAEIFKEITPSLSTFEMISIDQEDSPASVDSFFKAINFKRCLYGNGIDALLLNLENYQTALTDASTIRDSTGGFFKTYSWTVERKKTIKSYFTKCKVDGLLVNLNGRFIKPVKNARKICSEYNFSIAQRKDLNEELKTKIANSNN